VRLTLLQQPMGLRGLGHGEHVMATEDEGTRSKKRHGLIDGFESAVRCWRRQRNTPQVGCVLVGKCRHPCRSPNRPALGDGELGGDHPDGAEESPSRPCPSGLSVVLGCEQVADCKAPIRPPTV
jgi:hypothetical protein